MDTKFEKLLVQALALISATANQAWWHDKGEHCGSDFQPITCQRCFAYEQCKRNEKLIELFKSLQTAVD